MTELRPESHAGNLKFALETLQAHSKDTEDDAQQSLGANGDLDEFQRRRILSNMKQLQTKLADPVHFLSELARQVSDPSETSLELSFELMEPSEPSTCLCQLAGRVSDLSSHPHTGIHNFQKLGRAGRCPRTATTSRNSDDRHG